MEEEVAKIVSRAKKGMYVMSCYLTKDDLHNQIREDFYKLVAFVDRLGIVDEEAR